MAKERIEHRYELGRDLDIHEPDSAKVPPTRARRHAKEPRPTRVGWPKVLLLLLVVGLALFGILVMINDLRGGGTSGDPNPVVVTTESTILLDESLISPDTVKRRLEKAGYDVMPLVNSYDRTQHGYDVAETIINGNKAQILAFPDKAVTRDFVNVGAGTGYVLVAGDLWAISLGQGEDAKPLAEEIAGKLNARFFWTPQGD